MPLGLRISCKAGLDYRALLDLLVYGPDSWRSGFKRYIQNWKDLGSNPNVVTKLPVTSGSSKYQTQ